MKDYSYDGKQLFMIHFDHAGRVEKDEKLGAEKNLRHAKETIGNFLQP